MKLTPEDFCELCSIDPRGKVGMMWRCFAWQLIDGKPAKQVIADLSEAAKLPRVAVYASMNRALEPVLSLGPKFWEFVEMHPQATASGLAKELARIWKEDEDNGHYEDAAEARGESGPAVVAHGE